MRGLHNVCGALTLGCLAGIAALAQDKTDPPPKSDPLPKLEAVPRGFRMHLVTDARYEITDERNRVGKLHDPVTEHGLFPVIGVWSRTIPTTKDDPVVKVIEKVETLTKKYQNKRIGAFVAFLSLKKNFEDDDDRDTRRVEISNISRDWKFVQVGLAEQTSAQNAAWQLDAKGDDMKFTNQITVVIYNRLKIAGRWEFSIEKQPTEADLDKIAAALDEMLGKKPAVPKKEVEKK